MDWSGLGFRVDEALPCRLRWTAQGDTDQELAFIDLPAPIAALMAGPVGVTMQCANRGIYNLWTRTTLDDVVDGWTITRLA